MRLGTGFAISPSWVLTAAHNFDDIGGPNLEIEVAFPAGRTLTAQRIIHPQYAAGRAAGYDAALLKVQTGALASISQAVALDVFDDAFLDAYRRNKGPAVVAGFPNDMPGLVAGNGPLVGFDATTIAHLVDTAKQQSGAPLLYITRGTATALGIHGRGDPLGRTPPKEPNLAARMTGDLMDWIERTLGHYGA